MSIEAVARVLRDTETKGNDRLVLIALADYANDDGTGVYPSLPKIAAKANCEERTVIRCLKNLVKHGHIEEVGKTPKGTRAWRVLTGLPNKPSPVKMSGVETPTPDKRDSGSMTSTTPTPDKRDKSLMEEPSIEPSVEPKKKRASRSGEAFKPDDDDPVDAAIVEVFQAWHSGTGKNGSSTLTVIRAGLIRARLKEAAVGATEPSNLEVALAHAKAEVLEAVAGMVGSKWHRENQHQDFTQLFRNRERIEFFVGRHREQLAKGGGGDGGDDEFEQYGGVVERGAP